MVTGVSVGDRVRSLMVLGTFRDLTLDQLGFPPDIICTLSFEEPYNNLYL